MTSDVTVSGRVLLRQGHRAIQLAPSSGAYPYTAVINLRQPGPGHHEILSLTPFLNYLH